MCWEKEYPCTVMSSKYTRAADMSRLKKVPALSRFQMWGMQSLNDMTLNRHNPLPVEKAVFFLAESSNEIWQ